QELLLHLLALVLQQLAPRYDDVTPRLVDLEDLALDAAADVVADVGRTADVHLAGGQEDVDADVDEQAALDLAGDHAADDIALLVPVDDRLPLLLPFGLPVRQHDRARLVLDRFEEDLHLIAGLRDDDLVESLVIPLSERNDALGLVAN